ncbi:MAG: arginyltransferase [Rhodospirillaceae bacterium]|nr:arginyltransferase [Rhodospirillaceae bacterium]|tara:strand:+ start:301 stop:1020 length:720 start_codon:yes stop_codon:yes gene_type:complete
MNETPFFMQLKFYKTPQTTCPYLPNKKEQLIFTHLDDLDSDLTHDFMAKSGFRRSHGILYKPDCNNCNACMPIRINAKKFNFSKKYLRVLNKNTEITSKDVRLLGSIEQYELFNKYQKTRHKNGNMSLMQFKEYKSMVEDSPVNTILIEYRNNKDELLAVSLTDQLFEGYSMVYSFFDPKEKKKSLGNFMILDHINRARQNNYSYIYLGYYVKNCSKMSYKKNFKPLEILQNNNWDEFN